MFTYDCQVGLDNFKGFLQPKCDSVEKYEKG